MSTAAGTMMQPGLTPAVQPAPGSKHFLYNPALATRAEPSAFGQVLRFAIALVGCFVLVVSLVDPLRGSDRFDVTTATQDQWVRHE